MIFIYYIIKMNQKKHKNVRKMEKGKGINPFLKNHNMKKRKEIIPQNKLIYLDDFFEKVLKKAMINAYDENRNTIIKKDIKNASLSILQSK